MKKISLIASLVLLTASFCHADTLTVDDDGPADYDKIQDAINDAVDGDIVQVLQGHYFENIDFRGKAITVTSTDPNNPTVVELMQTAMGLWFLFIWGRILIQCFLVSQSQEAMHNMVLV